MVLRLFLRAEGNQGMFISRSKADGKKNAAKTTPLTLQFLPGSCSGKERSPVKAFQNESESPPATKPKSRMVLESCFCRKTHG